MSQAIQVPYISQKDIQEASVVHEFPKFGPLGSVVDLRTYRRWSDTDNRRESFWERNARVANYNASLASKLDRHVEQDARKVFDFMNQFLAFPSGRTMWVGGTKVSDAHPAANFNCSALAINRLGAFTTLFELLMLGTGVGYRVFSSDISQLPSIKGYPNLVLEDYAPLKKSSRQQETTQHQNSEEETIYVTVGDSRRGWIQSVEILLNVWFGIDESTERPIKRISFNLNSIRPMGERIQGFGGTASGPEALGTILTNIQDILKECPTNRLRSIDCMDICDCIAKGVVAGSSRRSALICLFEEGDDLCAHAKRGLYSNPEMQKKLYRNQSNNTECVGSSRLPAFREFLENNPDADWFDIKSFIGKHRPSIEWLKDRFEVVKAEGEPGFNSILMMAAKRWKAVREHRPDCPVEEIWVRYCNVVTNPCHEIVLSAGYSEKLEDCGKGVSFCNLTTIPLQNYVVDKKLQKDLLKEAIELCVRIGLRQTCVTMPTQELNETQAEERLLGVSATGWRMMFDLLGWTTTSGEVKDLQADMRAWANNEATRYALELGVPRPLLVTCIKPEGTSSKVFGSTDGLHWDWAEYYIRRIQMSTTDALAKTLKAQGFPWNPKDYDINYLIKPESKLNTWQKIEVFNALSNKEKDDIFEQSMAVTFDFPIKSPAKIASSSVSAIEQLENMLSFSTWYTDHMPSSTITVKANEWDGVANWIHNNWTEYTTTSMFSYYNEAHPLLPYEDITKEEYYQMLTQFKEKYKHQFSDGRVTFMVDETLLAQKEYEDVLKGLDIDELLDAGCSVGCPIR